MTDLLISDLHLSPERPAVCRAFFDFLTTTAENAQRLFILGDLVEAWIGDDNPEPLSRDIIAALNKLSAAGTRVYIQHGNRDFLIGRRFARETGATLLEDYHVIANGERRILLCHGDTLCSDDEEYQRFRQKVRHPLVRWLLAHLPRRKRQKMAREWRAKSREANSNKASNIMDVNSATVADAMARYRADLLIHGHTHRPAVHRESQGIRIVLGDWEEKGWYVRLENGEASLESFAIEN